MAKYCKFKSYMHGAPPADWDKEYYSPMYGDNGLYNKVPLDATPIYLLMPKVDDEERYGELEDCIDAILTALEVDSMPMVSLGVAYSSPDLYAVIDDPDTFFGMCASMCGYNGKYILYTPGWRYYSPTATSDYGVGNIDLTGGYKACWAFDNGGGDHALGGFNHAFMQSIAGTDRFVYIFDVFPYDVFRTGKFDFSVMKDAVGHPGDTDWKRYATIRVEIWEESDGDFVTYNCSAQIYGTDMNITTLNDNYQGTGTTVYDNGKPMTPGQKNDDPPGSGTRPNESVPIPNLPSGDMTATGSLRLYKLTAADIKSMFDYLHSHDPGTSIVKWWTNPIQGIISLHYLPYAMRVGTAEHIKVLGMDTGVSAYPSPQFQSIHFGYLDYELDSGTYLDYSPYTKTSIYLPGIGIRELNTDDVMNKRIWVVYHCDNVTGQFAAYVASAAKGENESKASVKYCFSGQVSASFPVSQENWGNTYIAGATLAAGALATGVVAAGGAAAAGGGAAAGAAEGTAAGAAESGITASGVAGAGVSIGNSLSQLAKPSITRSGAVTGTTSLFAVKKPYLIIESPNYYNYEGFDSTKGYPYGLYGSFKSLKGYAVIEGVHLTGIPATVTELNEIETLLKSGVHF